MKQGLLTRRNMLKGAAALAAAAGTSGIADAAVAREERHACRRPGAGRIDSHTAADLVARSALRHVHSFWRL